MNRTLALAASLAMISIASTRAAALSFNIDFGNAGSPPAATYSAAGLPGTWNAIGVPTPGTFYPLLNLAGQLSGATLNNIGGTQLLLTNDPATGGNDGALIDDMLIGFNNPVDVCIWINNIPSGQYEVLIYALTPNNPNLMCRTRVDFADQGPVFIGGAWPGGHELGVTYSRHTVTIANNQIGLHSGLWNMNAQSGINGIQLRQIIPGDANGDDSVDVDDLLAIINNWGSCPKLNGCPSDIAPLATGDGEINVDDLLQVINNWD